MEEQGQESDFMVTQVVLGRGSGNPIWVHILERGAQGWRDRTWDRCWSGARSQGCTEWLCLYIPSQGPFPACNRKRWSRNRILSFLLGNSIDY